MDVRRMRVATQCPACGQPELMYTAANLDIPYFGGIVETLILCAACGFKHADVINNRIQEPTRFTLNVTSEDHLNARVVRSTSGTIRIPELGVTIEPGAASEAYVSNTEGVLVRIEAVIGQLLRDAETEDARAKATERLDQLQRARNGGVPFTLIIEDPYGNSLIAADTVVREPIPPEEAERLARGEVAIDLSELEGATNGHPTNGADANP